MSDGNLSARKFIEKVAVMFYSSIFNESESKSCSIQFISCLILIVSDCVWSIPVVDCVIVPDGPWLTWVVCVWLIFEWLIIEWLEDAWLIRTAVTSGCAWSGLFSWFPKALWPSFEGNELFMVHMGHMSRMRSYEVMWGHLRSDELILGSVWTVS